MFLPPDHRVISLLREREREREREEGLDRSEDVDLSGLDEPS